MPLTGAKRPTTQPTQSQAPATPTRRRAARHPWMTNCPNDGEGSHAWTGTLTRQDRTRPPMTGPGRTNTERPMRCAGERANACARANSANDATATRPDDDRSDTRHDTKPQEPCRNAAQTTDEKLGTNEATKHLPRRTRDARRAAQHGQRTSRARRRLAANARRCESWPIPLESAVAGAGWYNGRAARARPSRSPIARASGENGAGTLRWPERGRSPCRGQGGKGASERGRASEAYR